MVERELGPAGNEVLIEERLTGEEVSLLAFTDGITVRPMPPAQDHKRLLDGDQGPNTGGMGAYAPAPICTPALVDQLTATVLQPTVDGLRAEGTPFVGVLYAGLMLTADGPRVLEFNCRFGDPETQALLPLLDTDLLDITEACAEGSLDKVDIRWKPGAAACVVLASAGYPAKYPTGRRIQGLEAAYENAVIFHAGTKTVENTAAQEGSTFTAGGRVLGVTGWGTDLKIALAASYAAVAQVHFEGMQYRKDIGWRAINGQKADKRTVSQSVDDPYASSGVSIDAGNRAVELMKSAVKSTYGPEVLAGIGAFGGLYDAAALQGMHAPVLVASTDGVGTKVKLAAQAGRYQSIGHDIVNHCTNDILVQGARPLFFLDYFATSKLVPEITAEIVAGISAACRAAGCALLGGETAEMPGVYQPGEFDVAGTIIGIVERAEVLPRPEYLCGRCPDRPALLRPAHQWLFTDPQDLRGCPPRHSFPRAGYSPRRCPSRSPPLLSTSPPAHLVQPATRHSPPAALHQGSCPSHRRRFYRKHSSGATRKCQRRHLPGKLARAAAVHAHPTARSYRHRGNAPRLQYGHRHGGGGRPRTVRGAAIRYPRGNLPYRRDHPWRKESDPGMNPLEHSARDSRRSHLRARLEPPGHSGCLRLG